MDSKIIETELAAFRKRLLALCDQYSDLAESSTYVEVEDKARRARVQLGRAQDSLESLSVELARAEKHMKAMVEAERTMHKKRKTSGENELTACHAVLRDFSSSEVFKLK